MTRRQFLRSAGAAGLLAGLGRAASPASPAGRRPSILFAISDDQSWCYAGAYGDRLVRTPAFDRVAREGVLFTHAFCSAPSCTPSRGAILTGQDFFRLEEGADLWSTLPAHFPVYPDLLEAAGYRVGFTGKGWGPGRHQPGGRKRNPAGPSHKSFEAFLKTVPPDAPFAFWFGSYDPHRPYDAGSGLRAGKKLEDVRIPPFLPDVPEVRSDLLDYFVEIERFDRDVGKLLDALDAAGRRDDTIVVVTGDNGLPFPRAKANLYDAGTRMPLAIRWPARIRAARRIEDLVGHADLAPTFLEAAGLEIPKAMTGRSLLPLAVGGRDGWVDPSRDAVLVGRERHVPCHAGGGGYPARAIRTRDFLYIRNFAPDRWPAGDPDGFGDIDGGPTKTWLLAHRADPGTKRLFDLACAKRPAVELYDLRADPDQLENVAGRPALAEAEKALRERLDRLLAERGDPRAAGEGDAWDSQPYYGGGVPAAKKKA
ncbi:MAG: sulfatase [Planctomycetes bacterium]|nr:sulfatase [Planctomycetota bacterium]